jgi:hypothetical protein
MHSGDVTFTLASGTDAVARRYILILSVNETDHAMHAPYAVVLLIGVRMRRLGDGTAIAPVFTW